MRVREEARTTQGKCYKCGVIFEWPTYARPTVRLEDACCPNCGWKLERTSRQNTTLRRQSITRPLFGREARRIFGALLVALSLAGAAAGQEAKVSQTRGVGLAPNTALVLLYDRENEDAYGLHSPERPECLVIQTPGNYTVGATVQWSLHEKGSRDLMIWRKREGSPRKLVDRDLSPPAQDIVTTHSVTTFAENLESGECLYVMIQHSAPVGINAVSTAFWVKR